MTYEILKLRLPTSLVALCASVAVAVTATTPGPARADKGGLIAGAIVAGAIICASNPKACGGRDRGNRGAAAGGSGGDAIAMNRDQRMMVQGGLQNLGFYTGAIDGAIGAGSRPSDPSLRRGHRRRRS